MLPSARAMNPSRLAAMNTENRGRISMIVSLGRRRVAGANGGPASASGWLAARAGLFVRIGDRFAAEIRSANRRTHGAIPASEPRIASSAGYKRLRATYNGTWTSRARRDGLGSAPAGELRTLAGAVRHGERVLGSSTTRHRPVQRRRGQAAGPYRGPRSSGPRSARGLRPATVITQSWGTCRRGHSLLQLRRPADRARQDVRVPRRRARAG